MTPTRRDRLVEMSGEAFVLGKWLRRAARRVLGLWRAYRLGPKPGPVSYAQAKGLFYPHANAILLDGGVRSRSASYRKKLDQFLSKRSPLTGPPRITFLLNVLDRSGGVLSVVQLVNDLLDLGMDIRVVVRCPDNYAGDIGLKTTPVFYKDRRALICHLAKDTDMIVGTLWSTMYYVMEAFLHCPSFIPTYFVQDFEPLFYPEERPDLRYFAQQTYTFTPYCFAKTPWICSRVREVGGSIEPVPPGLDLDLFTASDMRRPADPKIILTMLRPNTPRRGTGAAIETLTRLAEHRSDIDIHVFGCSDEALKTLDIPFPFTNHGLLPNHKLPQLYSRAYLYADFSEFHGFGRTIAEAMACGTPCVTTQSGGIDAFVRHGENALCAPVGDTDGLFMAMNRLLDDETLYETLAGRCRKAIAPFDRTRSAEDTKDFLIECLK